MNRSKNSFSGLTNQLKEKLIQKNIERKLKHLDELSDQNVFELPSTGAINSDNISEEFYRFDRTSAYQKIKLIYSGAERLGLQNPFFKVHDGLAGSHTKVSAKDLINFSSYNYLDLSGDPRVNSAAKDAIDEYGTSVSASRLVSGERAIHRELELEIANTYGTDDAIAFVSGHATNVSTISQLFGPRDLILHDEYIHNSVLQGTQLSGAKRFAFSHNDVNSLDRLLSRHRHNYERVLVVTEGIFSMDGDFPDLPKFIELKDRYRAFLMVDEAHSLGVIGKHGLGLSEYFGLKGDDVDIWMGTLSKSLGGCGGYIAGNFALIEQLKFFAPGFLYSVGMSPPLAAASLAALRIMLTETHRVSDLQNRSQYFLKQAKEAGINTGTSAGMGIIPAIVGESIKAIQLSSILFDNGINVQPVVYPAVTEKQARLRFFISCNHTESEIDYTINTLSKALKAI